MVSGSVLLYESESLHNRRLWVAHPFADQEQLPGYQGRLPLAVCINTPARSAFVFRVFLMFLTSLAGYGDELEASSPVGRWLQDSTN